MPCPPRPPLVGLIEGLALRSPRPTAAAVYRQVVRVAQEQGWPVPSYSTVYAVIRALDPAALTLAHAGTKAYANAFDLIHRRAATRPNELWQADHTPLDLWVLDRRGRPARSVRQTHAPARQQGRGASGGRISATVRVGKSPRREEARMSENTSMGTGTTPLPATLLQMMTGYWVSQALYVAAKLGIADLLAAGPRSTEDLAAATQTDASSLHRVLRALASIGVFTEARPRHFALTPLAELLRTDVTGSMRALAIMYAEEQYRAWGEVLHSVCTGQTAFEQQYGMPYFAYLAQHPGSDRVFNEAMTGWTTQLADAVVDAYDFSPFHTVVDVGGSYGTLLAAILRRHAGARGILFDQPHVVAAAGDHLAAAGIADRCRCVGGDFFIGVPTGGDAYVLAQILHDWDDERSIDILKQCRRAIPAHGKLLVVELVLPEGEEPFFGKWLDLHMLVLLGARERTAAQYDALFRHAGFQLARVIATPPGPSIVEAVPV